MAGVFNYCFGFIAFDYAQSTNSERSRTVAEALEATGTV